MKSIPLTLIFCIVIFCGISPSTSADPFKIKPLLSLKLEYSDNILFSLNQPDTDLISTASGGVTVGKKTELLNANIQAKVNKLLYNDFDELNSLDNLFSGQLNYKVTQRLGMGAQARYVEDSRRDQDTETTGLLISGQRKSTNFSLLSGYLFSETLKGDITLGYGSVETKAISSTENNDQFQVDITFSKNLSQLFKNTTGIFNISYLHYNSDIDSFSAETVVADGADAYLISSTTQQYKSDIFQASTGFSKDISEIYNIYFMGGGSYTRTNEILDGNQIVEDTIWTNSTHSNQKDHIWGGVLSTGLNYNGIYYDMGLSLSQDMRGASGTNGAVQRSSVSGNIHKKVTSNLSLSLESSYYLNRNKRKTETDTDELTLNLQTGFKYRFVRDFTLSGVYRFTSVENREDCTTRKRNMIYLIFQKAFEL